MTCPRLSSSVTEFRESSHCSQDSMREDSFVSSTGPDQYSETAVFSGSDSEAQGPPTPPQDQPPDSALSESEPAPLELPSSEENHVEDPPSEVCFTGSDEDVLPVSEPLEEVHAIGFQERTEPSQELKEAETSLHQGTRRSASILSRKLSSESLSVSICRQRAFRFKMKHTQQNKASGTNRLRFMKSHHVI